MCATGSAPSSRAVTESRPVSGATPRRRRDKGSKCEVLTSCRRAHPLATVSAVSALILFGLAAVWSFVTPIGASNDEEAQVLRAVSVVRGEILGTPLTRSTARTLSVQQLNDYTGCLYSIHEATGVSGSTAEQRCYAPFTIVTVPESFARGNSARPCNALPYFPDVCPNHLNGSDRPVKAISYVGRYPPLYYFVVGLPSLVSQSDVGLYAMRLVSGVLTAVMTGLALAIASTSSGRKLLVLGVAVAATPMLLIFGSTVNPSGLEMSSALCAWTGVLVLWLDRSESPPRSLVAATTAASSVLVLSRGISPLWLLLIIVFAVALDPAATRRLSCHRRVRIGAGITAAATILALGYVAWADPLSVEPGGTKIPVHANLAQVVETVIGQAETWILQFTGGFGWALTPPPLAGYAVMLLAIGLMVAFGLLTASRRHIVVLLLLMFTAVGGTIVMVASRATTDGIVWQARDGFPLYAGVILVGAATARLPRWSSSEPDRAPAGTRGRAVLLIVACVAFSQVADIVWALRRYTHGVFGTLNPFVHVAGAFWPPLPVAAILIGASALSVAWAWWIWFMTCTVGGEHDAVVGPSGLVEET
jgi:Predicted membrane protein (DUF2142)